MLRRAVTAILRSTISRQVINAWCNALAPRHAPWFEQPDPEETIRSLISRGLVSDADAAIMRHWVRDGYFVVRGAVPTAEVDAIREWIDSLAIKTTPIPGVRLLGIRETPGAPLIDITHREFLSRWGREDRQRILAESSWRVHGLHRWHRSVRRVARNEELVRLASLIFQRTAVPSGSITFARGSGQALHQDMAVFHIQPRGYLLGCWVACEDIQADSGPLVYCPGSHQSPVFKEFDDYPRTNLRTCPTETDSRYHEWVSSEATRYEQKRFLGCKGDVLFWNSMLFHGGDAILRTDSTRRSVAIHYMVRGSNRAWAVPGPFKW